VPKKISGASVRFAADRSSASEGFSEIVFSPARIVSSKPS
jgi:hypothetical protein